MADGLRFRIREFRDELTTLQQIGATFFDSGAEVAFRRLETQIDALWNYPEDRTAMLEMDSKTPLRTRPSQGRYEHQGGGTFKSLHAVFTSAWHVRVRGQRSRKASGNRCFEIHGEASTVTELWVDPSEAPDRFEPNVPNPCCIASWRLEVGNMTEDGKASPGPLFHAQVPRLAPEANVPHGATSLWPHWLSVPRMHTFPFTPMLAIEFGLAEVFQEEWSDYVRSIGSQGTTVKHWANLHRTRFRAFLDWQKEALDRADAGTPLVGLKELGMPIELLIGPS